MAKTTLGRLDARAFGPMELPRLDRAILDGFRALGDLTGTTSDAMDECRINGVVPGSTLRPTDAKARVVGRAITVLNQRREAGEMKKSGLGEIEAHNLAEPGDVLVIQGIAGVSSMGGVSASVGKRQGEAGLLPLARLAPLVEHSDRPSHHAGLRVSRPQGRAGHHAVDAAFIHRIGGGAGEIAQRTEAVENRLVQSWQFQQAEGLGLQPAERSFGHTMFAPL